MNQHFVSLVTEKNIHNLTSLWTLAGNAAGQYFQQNDFSYCLVPGSEWPNRIWLNNHADAATIRTVADVIKNTPVPLTVSYWNHTQQDLHPVFEQLGFSVKSEQTGMSLKLDKAFEQLNRLNLVRITTPEQAAAWEALYPLSFGYRITADILNKTSEDVQYYLVYHQQEAMGTAIVHETGNLMGIHGVGIVPAYRKQGFAEEVMAILLNSALAQQKEMATLQSSAMGKNIYLKLGFAADFKMTNYQLK
ncbi:acetyltransferase (GNAT) family protein [Chitinophaga polysaccharea]|uniref:Acetyltransferase (GNAT) family protein n=1 Tax=Chitinophaga polysaccharea TaxID=1293035 RepID=A0A561P171_9BACT|nr:GNAT family N-acetyltransferase [Chitinophaga polysaccharea]TWF31835.1 acetyltransferase (GNAT) family protein [Chitinophaga polysaccharea]